MKKVCLFLLSAVLTVAMAFGLVACGGNTPSGNNPGGTPGTPGGDDNPPPTPPTPTVTVDVEEISLILGESITVTATVTNSEKAPVFTLEGTTVASVSAPTNGKTATIKALSAGTTKLTVSLEGAQSVEVPVTVENATYRFNAAAALTDNTKVFDAGVTGVDDGDTATVSVVHFIKGAKVEVASDNESVATVELNEETATATVTTHQAGVAEITVTLLTVKQTEEEPAPTADEEVPAPEYEELHSETYTVVCTDDWIDAAEEYLENFDEPVFGYREVTGGYEAYIASTADALGIDTLSGELRVPAIYNRKPVVSIGKNNDGLVLGYFLGFAEGVASNDVVENYNEIYAAVKTVYLPCTLTSVPDLTFRRAVVETVVFQEGSHITRIGVQAFNDVLALKSINLEDLRELKKIDVQAFARAGETSQKLEVVIPNCLEVLERRAFWSSGVTKVEFELAKKNTDDEFVPSIELKLGSQNAALNDPEGKNAGITYQTGMFGYCAKLTELTLRNIKDALGVEFGDNLLIGCIALEKLYIGEDIAADGVLGLYTFVSAFVHDPVEIYFEGNSQIARSVTAYTKVPAFATYGDSAGGLIYLFPNWHPTGSHNDTIYISTDIAIEDVSNYITERFQQDEAYDSTTNGYTKWTRKPAST